MSPMRLLLFSALGLGGLLVFSGTASAMSRDETPPRDPPEPAPKPATAPTGVPFACQSVFNRWKALADQSLAACQRAANLAEEWWVWEEYRVNGEYSYDAAYHEQIRRDWYAAQQNCDSINAASLQAMADYEDCAS